MGKFGWSYPPGAANDPFAPYNEDYNDTVCIYCGAALPDDVTGYAEINEDAVNEGFCNDAHRQLFDKNGPSDTYGQPQMTQAEQDRRDTLATRLNTWRANRKDKPATLDDFTGDFLPEGDFEWEGMEAGDWHVYCCGEKDCSQQWHTIAHAEDFARKDGKLSITLRSVDADGNWDIDGGWEEGEDFESCVGWALGEGRLNDYFSGWADYWLDAAVTGKDPCDQTLREVNPSEWVSFCLDGAENMMKGLN